MLNAAENHSSFSAPVEEKAHRERLIDAKIELQNITGVLELVAGEGETPIESAITWLIPKLENVADTMDRIDLDTLKEQHFHPSNGGAA